jgi:hypothetical protein
MPVAGGHPRPPAPVDGGGRSPVLPLALGGVGVLAAVVAVVAIVAGGSGQLTPGDCVRVPEWMWSMSDPAFAESWERGDHEVVACDEPHHLEVLHRFAGTEELGGQTARDYCVQEHFEPYVGVNYGSSVWYLDAFHPTDPYAMEGDEGQYCFVVDRYSELHAEPARNSRR